jgi:alpha-galactosidase
MATILDVRLPSPGSTGEGLGVRVYVVSQEPVTFELSDDLDRLTLTHPHLAATWSWHDGRITWDRLDYLPAQTSWLDAVAVSPLFVLGFDDGSGDRQVVGTVGELGGGLTVGARADGVATADHHFSLPDTPLTLNWHVESRAEHAVIRQWFEVLNDSDAPVTITRMPILSAALGRPAGDPRAHCGLKRTSYQRRNEWPDWFTWRSLDLPPGVADAVHSGYRQEATWLGLTTEGDGPGLYLGWESNAAATCEFGDLHGDGAVWLECFIEPEYVLQPGQTLTGPAGFIGLAAGDLDEISYRCQRFVDETLAWRAEDERFPFVEFNSWGYGAEIDDASMRRCFEICQRLGVELFVVDFGWEDPDWKPLPDRFPNGLAPLAEAAHAAGMLFGVHLSFGNVSNLSAMYRKHPEWANGPGQWAYHREGEVFGLTLGNPATREWMVQELVEIVDENKIDYFLTDHYLWGPTNPEVQQRHATDDYLTIAEGFDWILERFHALRPHLLIEHCDNGIGLPTFKMVQQHVTSIGPDAVGSLYERLHTWRISRVLPPRYLDHYVTEHIVPGQAMRDGLLDYEYRSQLLGGPMILMTDLMALEEGTPEWDALARNIALFKRIRKPVLDSKILHLLEPQPLQRVGNGWDGWDAIGAYHEATDSAVIFAFRLGGDRDERIIPLHGLRPQSRYQVSFEDRPDTFTVSGAALMTEGVFLTLPHPDHLRRVDPNGMVRASEVIFLTPTAETNV